MINEDDRTVYFDFLKAIGSIGVMLLHIASQNWRNVPVDSFEWNFFNIIDGSARWCVPVFLMISGALFLERDYGFRELFSKYILRIALAILFWTGIYCIFSALRGHGKDELRQELILGHYHMWYLYMLIGVYLTVPFLKCIIRNTDMVKAYLVASLVIGIALPHFFIVATSFGRLQNLQKLFGSFKLDFFMGYLFYFVLGYYINREYILIKWLYWLGTVGFISIPILTLLASRILGTATQVFYEYRSLSVVFESIFVFTSAKRYFMSRQVKPITEKVLRRYSKLSLGVYLIHPLVLENVNYYFGLNTLSFNSIGAVAMILVALFVCSFVLAEALSKIPIIGKYIGVFCSLGG